MRSVPLDKSFDFLTLPAPVPFLWTSSWTRLAANLRSSTAVLSLPGEFPSRRRAIAETGEHGINEVCSTAARSPTVREWTRCVGRSLTDEPPGSGCATSIGDTTSPPRPGTPLPPQSRTMAESCRVLPTRCPISPPRHGELLRWWLALMHPAQEQKRDR